MDHNPVVRYTTTAAESVRVTGTSTWPPAAVNFTAFDSRFTRTWRKRAASPRTRQDSEHRSTDRPTCFSSNLSSIVRMLSRTTSLMSTSLSASRIFPVAMRDKSSRSSIRVVDLGMPQMDGFEFISRIRESGDPDIPIASAHSTSVSART